MSRTLAAVLGVGVVTLSACAAEAERRADGFEAVREDALARARVFRGPFTPDHLAEHAVQQPDLACRFVLTAPTGTTPKFDCELPDGSRVKVKYGGKPEIPAEVAATRLLRVLGFGADRVMLVERVRCYGCPPAPFHTRRVANRLHLEGLLRRTRNDDGYRDFEWAAVEYKMEGRAVESETAKGWSFAELERVAERRGGASRADVDALRLIAVFLAHWDNKDANQRLVCLPSEEPDGSCLRPLVMLHDVGATFGPRKVELDAWRATPIWADAERCRVSMRGLPHMGGTFGDVEISEAGRRVLAERLTRVSTGQIERLFAEARFPGDPGEWAAVFERKVAEIAARPPCPA